MEASSFLFPSPRWGRTFCFVTVILHRRDDGRKIEQDDREKRERGGDLEKPISYRCRSRSFDWRVIDVKKEQQLLSPGDELTCKWKEKDIFRFWKEMCEFQSVAYGNN